MKLFQLQLQRRSFFKILMPCVSAITTLLLCEVALQFVLPPLSSKEYYIWPPRHKTVFKPYQDVMLGISGDAEFRTNSNGIRGDEIEPQHSSRILPIPASPTHYPYSHQH